jgi:hypothetical protein
MENYSIETIEVAMKFAKWLTSKDDIDYNFVYNEWSIYKKGDWTYLSNEELFSTFLQETDGVSDSE